MRLSYDGSCFHGFASQPEQRTVAGELLGALRAIDPQIAEVRGASRTDAGVHARDQRVAFDSSKTYPLTAWTHGAQRHLPEQISIWGGSEVEAGYNPRFHALAKTYRYTLLSAEARDPFWCGRSWRVPEACGEEALARMSEEARAAIGTLDFAAFRGASDARDVTVRTVSKLELRQSLEDPRLVFVDVRGDGFLYNMVRILVGTLVDVGRGRLAPGAIARALASKDRRDAGITAPPDGLSLHQFELEGDDARGWI